MIRRLSGILAKHQSLSIVRSLFILVLIAANTMCFATEAEELQRLQHIVGKIITKVNLDRSVSKLAHNELIQQEKKLGRNYTVEELDVIMPRILRKLRDSGIESCKFDNIFSNYLIQLEADPKDADALASILKPLVKIWLTHPDKQQSVCDHYALFAFSIVMFDIMNTQAAGGENNLFTSVSILVAQQRTGQHMATLVEGASGNIYLVDPWGEKVVKLDTLTEDLSWKSQSIAAFLKGPKSVYKFGGTHAAEITRIYADEGYYDMAYVRPTTQWTLFPYFSDNFNKLIRTEPNKVVGLLYTAMKPSFADWKPYDQLFIGDKKVISSEEKPADKKDSEK